jgi:hypothetical protein
MTHLRACGRNYFPNAEIHFIDCLSDLKLNYLRGAYFITLIVMMKYALSAFSQKERDFDIILDDSAHTMKAQQMTFKFLWPLVKSQGYYVVEDLHTSFGFRYHKYCNPDNTKSTTYEMVDVLRSQRHDFESNHVSLDFLTQQRKIIDFVQIFNPTGCLEQSVTSVIKKK